MPSYPDPAFSPSRSFSRLSQLQFKWRCCVPSCLASTGTCRARAPVERQEKATKVVPHLPIAKPLRLASTLYNSHHHQLSTLSCISVWVAKLDQNASSSLFCCPSAATVPLRSCTRLGTNLRSGTFPRCRLRTQALTKQPTGANCLFTAVSTPICHRFLREGESRQVSRPEGF